MSKPLKLGKYLLGKPSVLTGASGQDQVSFDILGCLSTMPAIPAEKAFITIRTARGFGLQWLKDAFGIEESEVEVIRMSHEHIPFSRHTGKE